MPTLFVDSGSFANLQVTGSTTLSGSLFVTGSLVLNGSPVNTSAGTVTKGFVIAMATAM